MHLPHGTSYSCSAMHYVTSRFPQDVALLCDAAARLLPPSRDASRDASRGKLRVTAPLTKAYSQQDEPRSDVRSDPCSSSAYPTHSSAALQPAAHLLLRSAKLIGGGGSACATALLDAGLIAGATLLDCGEWGSGGIGAARV